MKFPIILWSSAPSQPLQKHEFPWHLITHPRLPITIIPASTASLELVPECNPMIIPKVVMTPDVSPKPTPFHKKLFIFGTLKMPQSPLIVMLYGFAP